MVFQGCKLAEMFGCTNLANVMTAVECERCIMGFCSAHWDSTCVLLGQIACDSLILFPGGKGISCGWCLVLCGPF